MISLELSVSDFKHGVMHLQGYNMSFEKKVPIYTLLFENAL